MYYIRLARELGMTVTEMLNRMSSLEIAEQRAYDMILADEAATGTGRRASVQSPPIPDPAEVTRRTYEYFKRRAGGPPTPPKA